MTDLAVVVPSAVGRPVEVRESGMERAYRLRPEFPAECVPPERFRSKLLRKTTVLLRKIGCFEPEMCVQAGVAAVRRKTPSPPIVPDRALDSGVIAPHRNGARRAPGRSQAARLTQEFWTYSAPLNSGICFIATAHRSPVACGQRHPGQRARIPRRGRRVHPRRQSGTTSTRGQSAGVDAACALIRIGSQIVARSVPVSARSVPRLRLVGQTEPATADRPSAG